MQEMEFIKGEQMGIEIEKPKSERSVETAKNQLKYLQGKSKSLPQKQYSGVDHYKYAKDLVESVLRDLQRTG
jgi:hypothetical protein